jgi:glyoxalase family protein
VIKGLHHITLLTRDALASVEFYSEILGLRMIKKTVNFDSPDTYHLYFGDQTGKPGSLVTIFPINEMQNPQEPIHGISAIAFEASPVAYDFWTSRLKAVDVQARKDRLTFKNPEGLTIHIDLKKSLPRFMANQESEIPSQFALQGISGLEITVHQPDRLKEFLLKTMGFRPDPKKDRIMAGIENEAVYLDLYQADPSAFRPKTPPVHHVAWRMEQEDQQQAWQQYLRDHDLAVTSVIDRQYFQSIYFRIPGLLFEIATDGPGFTVNESIKDLGSELQLPPWLESRRNDLLLSLPSLETIDQVY